MAKAENQWNTRALISLESIGSSGRCVVSSLILIAPTLKNPVEAMGCKINLVNGIPKASETLDSEIHPAVPNPT